MARLRKADITLFQRCSVAWVDIMTEVGWADSTTPLPVPAPCETLGWIIEANFKERKLVVASSHSPDSEGTSTWGERTVIPLANVTKITLLYMR